MIADHDALERAWELHAGVRDRTSAQIAATLVVVLTPLWGLVDYGFNPDYVPRMSAIRIAVVVLALAAGLVIRRSSRGVVDRFALLTLVLTTGIAAAYSTAAAEHYVTINIFGFSLIFWGFGLVLMWRWVFTVTSFAVTLGSYVLFWLAGSGHSDLPSFIGMLAYLVSAAAIATGISIVRRRLEHQAFIASSQLEDKNRELAAALATLENAQARFVATEKLSALGRLIAQLSHEINNPVNVIGNNLEPIADYLTSLEDVLDIARRQSSPSGDLARRWSELDIDFARTDMREAIAAMTVAAERIRTIQSDLRAFMRGDATLPIEADFNEGVRSTVAMLRRNMGSNTVLIERYGELPPARFHTGQLNQVTLNLLQNALDVVGSAGQIEIETRFERQGLLFSVTDSGPGVSEVARRHLFEPFFTTKDVGQGTGLGLATCYQIVRAHGGTITLDESYRRGARFVVSLPLTPPAVSAPRKPRELTEPVNEFETPASISLVA